MGRETATASLRETELPIFGRDLRSTMEIDLGEAEIDKLLWGRRSESQWRRQVYY